MIQRSIEQRMLCKGIERCPTTARHPLTPPSATDCIFGGCLPCLSRQAAFRFFYLAHTQQAVEICADPRRLGGPKAVPEGEERGRVSRTRGLVLSGFHRFLGRPAAVGVPWLTGGFPARTGFAVP